MAVDLFLLPMTADFGNSAFAHTTLEVERKRELWPLICSLPSQPVPPQFETLVSIEGPEELDNWMQGNTQTDAYEKPLVCVFAADLKPLACHPLIRDSYVNRAVWAYLAELPDSLRVAVYWT